MLSPLKGYERTMVLLEANHTNDHVLQEHEL